MQTVADDGIQEKSLNFLYFTKRKVNHLQILVLYLFWLQITQIVWKLQYIRVSRYLKTLKNYQIMNNSTLCEWP